ncbi:nuclear transport factor 2 family protein [Aquabacterium sp. OR-4]|uniref:nuclear transport factor 2 family protein n=1 Tax=Aquabacterium sp. OR-4 TaxID=2978127 RepID=UPI0021B1EC7E|nr:nuclear transport factor 2 family protein [Aquabacterium sp. OR-4]MDT7834040.1 nuclear transport factor 2 family protein [Aquabacterium sp. OR-4]
MARVVALFEQLTPASLARLGEVYADDARFIDPFNDVTGLAPIRRIFEHMFDTLQAPRFTVLTRFSAGDEAFLSWDFRFRRQGAQGDELLIHGASHLRFDADDRVLLHRDYWDAARQVYEQVPLLGAVLRWLRLRLAAR